MFGSPCVLLGAGDPRLLLPAYMSICLFSAEAQLNKHMALTACYTNTSSIFVACVLTSEKACYPFDNATVAQNMLSPNMYHMLPDIKMAAISCCSQQHTKLCGSVHIPESNNRQNSIVR